MSEYERALQAIFTAGAERRRRLRDAASTALDTAHERWVAGCLGGAQLSAQFLSVLPAVCGIFHLIVAAQLTIATPPAYPTPCRMLLFSHGAELFADDEAVLPVQRHLLRTVGAECVDALLRFLAADALAAEEEEEEGGAAVASPLMDAWAGPLSVAQRTVIMKQLQPDVKPAVSTAVDKLSGSSLEVRSWSLG